MTNYLAIIESLSSIENLVLQRNNAVAPVAPYSPISHPRMSSQTIRPRKLKEKSLTLTMCILVRTCRYMAFLLVVY